MPGHDISRATLGRIPAYVCHLKSLPLQTQQVSATTIARALGLGEVQVRKDLSVLCGSGRPKVGYAVKALLSSLEEALSAKAGGTIVLGAGKLGQALLEYGGFACFGLSLLAAFDAKLTQGERSPTGKPLLPLAALPEFCRTNEVSIGIIAVPAEAAQEACQLLYANGVKAMWCFAPCRLEVPGDAIVQYENLALSLAHLKMQLPAGQLEDFPQAQPAGE